MKRIVTTDQAPAAIGPYSQAISAGEFLFVSGQIAIDPGSGNLIQGSVEDETAQVMDNIGAILKAADLDFADVVKSSVFIRSMDDYARINSVYARYFDDGRAPARELVEVSRLPKDVHVEISVIALKS